MEQEKEHSIEKINDTEKKTIVASFILDEELHRRLKVYAALNGRKIKDVVNDAFNDFLTKREK